MTEMTSVIRVMYVEDIDLVREITCELLARDDREVQAFSTAEDALAEFERNPYDVVITDVSLPSMSGLSLARRIVEINPATAVIIASGYPLDFGAGEIGVNVRAILKPFEAAQIDSVIDSLLESMLGRD